jgi:adenosylhomocysteine nucleosidase
MTFAAVAISAGAEWRVVRNFYREINISSSPYGEWFEVEISGRPVVFVQGGWGKISAAASTQYLLDKWKPEVVINLGTCGGFAGEIERGTIILTERTLVYDIIEQMGDPQAAIRHYTVDLDLSWLREPYPQPVMRGLLVSADRDICLPDIPMLIERYHACAANWESGAIAWVTRRNGVRCLILRGVSDLVGVDGGEAYGAVEVFREGTRQVMEPMLEALPLWLECC